MPRSGHHLVHRILSRYLGDRLAYCNYYVTFKQGTFEDCCKNIPCTHKCLANYDIFFQKSHDFGLTDPVDTADLNLVQVRRPVDKALLKL